MFDLGKWFPLVMIPAVGLWYYIYKKDKKRFKNQITGDFTSGNPVTLVNPKFVEASTRMIELEEAPTAKYIEDVIENIKIVLAIHKINFGQEGYDDPWFLLSVNHAELRIRIYRDFFILNKGSVETTAKLNVNDITQALKQIGVLKGKK